MRRSDARTPSPPAAYRKSVPCPLCGGGTGVCVACRGERRVSVYLPLRRLTDEELRVHALRLFDEACAVFGSGAVWALSARCRIPVSEQRSGVDLGRAIGQADPPKVRDVALCMAREAGKIGRVGAVRALCEVARRARRGSWSLDRQLSALGLAESQLSAPGIGL